MKSLLFPIVLNLLILLSIELELFVIQKRIRSSEKDCYILMMENKVLIDKIDFLINIETNRIDSLKLTH